MDIASLRAAGMTAYAVGQPYSEAMQLPMPETPHLWIFGSKLELLISYPRPKQEEIEQFHHGMVRFAWVDSEQTAVFAVKLGDLPWADCPFHPRLIIDAGMQTPRLPHKSTAGKVLPMIFVNGISGIVVGIRMIGLPPKFVTAMSATITRMVQTPFNPAAHDDAIVALYGKYPTAAKLVRDRADITCIGIDSRDKRPNANLLHN